MAEFSVDSLQRGMLIVLLFGAARKDSTLEQLKRLREEALPILNEKGRPLSDVVHKVREIMGEDWEPTGDFRDHILSIAGEVNGKEENDR